MKIKIDDTKLAKMVFKTLVKILKDNGLYFKFRCFIGRNKNDNNLIDYIYNSLTTTRKYMLIADRYSCDNPFYSISDIKGICDTLKRYLGNDDMVKEGEEDALKIQRRVTQFTNTLLHCCLERITKGNLSILEEVGRETFETVCKDIFGDDFVDMTENDVPEEYKKMIDLRHMIESGVVSPSDLSNHIDFIELMERLRNERRRQYAANDNHTIQMMPYDGFDLGECDDIIDVRYGRN